MACPKLGFSGWILQGSLKDFKNNKLTGLATLFIALLTVSFQAVRAAVANPVESLRSE